MPQTAKHELKAHDILDKGTRILWSKGYNGTSVNDIVKAAGIPKGSFYFYFDSKEDFAIKALQYYFEMQFTPAKEILNNKDVSPKNRLLDFYKYRVRVLKEDMDCKMGCLATNLGSEISEHNENIRRTINQLENSVKIQIEEILREAQEVGEINQNVNITDLVQFIQDAGKGAMVSMKELNSSYPIDNFIQILENTILN